MSWKYNEIKGQVICEHEGYDEVICTLPKPQNMANKMNGYKIAASDDVLKVLKKLVDFTYTLHMYGSAINYEMGLIVEEAERIITKTTGDQP